MKNQLIAGKLDSLMSYEEELEKLHRQIDESKISVAEEQEREDSINKDLFRKMERIIKDEKLYLMPELVRQDMLARLSVDKKPLCPNATGEHQHDLLAISHRFEIETCLDRIEATSQLYHTGHCRGIGLFKHPPLPAPVQKQHTI